MEKKQHNDNNQNHGNKKENDNNIFSDNKQNKDSIIIILTQMQW